MKIFLFLIFITISLCSHAEDFFRKNYVYAFPSCEKPSAIRWWIDGEKNQLLLVNLNMSNLQIERFPVLKLMYGINANLPKGDFAFKYSDNSHEILTFYTDGTMRIKEANWNGNMTISDYHFSKQDIVGIWITCTNNYASNLISQKYVEYLNSSRSAKSVLSEIGSSSAQGYNKLILGKWHHKSESQLGDILVTSIYVQDFLANGVISDDKQIVIKSGDFLISCNIVTDWQWSIVDNNLYQKKIGVNVSPDFIKENGVLVDDRERLNNTCGVLKDSFNKSILKTSTFKILKLDDKVNVTETLDESGKPEISTDYRTTLGLSSFRIK